MSILVLIRPGCTQFDDDHRIQGTLDIPLNSRGERQVRQVVDEVQGLDLEVLYTSPCEPARSTAIQIGQEMGIPVKELPGLQNLNLGLWQGLTADEIRRKHPKVYKQWQETPESVCPPEGETIAQAAERLHRALEKPIKRDIPIGIVAPEPLAALIESIIQNVRFCLPDSGAIGDCTRLWQSFSLEKVKESFTARFGSTHSSWELVIPRIEKPQ